MFCTIVLLRAAESCWINATEYMRSICSLYMMAERLSSSVSLVTMVSGSREPGMSYYLIGGEVKMPT